MSAILNVGLLLPAIFRWVLPVTIENRYSFVFAGVSIPYPDLLFLILPFLAITWRQQVQRVPLVLGALGLLWNISAGLLQDPQFDLANVSAALDTYYPIILLSFIPIRLASAKPLRWLILGTIVYMSAQITAYSLGWLIWDRPLGYVIGDTSIIRINTTMGAATGAALLIATIFFIHFELTDRNNYVERVIASAGTVVSLLLLSSRGTFVVLIGAAALYIITNRTVARRLFTLRGLVAATAITGGIGIAVTIFGQGLEFRINEMKSSSNLDLLSTGRSSLWSQSSYSRVGAGWTGLGVGNIDPRDRPAESSRIDWEFRTHNTYLTVYYESGAVGTMLFCSVFCAWFANAFSKGRRHLGYWYLASYCIFAFVLESCPLSVDFMLPLFVLMSIVRQKGPVLAHVNRRVAGIISVSTLRPQIAAR